MDRIVLICMVPVYRRRGPTMNVEPTGGYRTTGEVVPVGQLQEVEFGGETRLALPLVSEESKFFLVEDLSPNLGDAARAWSSHAWQAGHAATQQEREYDRELADDCKKLVRTYLEELERKPLTLVS
jgi:hypothetical protein